MTSSTQKVWRNSVIFRNSSGRFLHGLPLNQPSVKPGLHLQFCRQLFSSWPMWLKEWQTVLAKSPARRPGATKNLCRATKVSWLMSRRATTLLCFDRFKFCVINLLLNRHRLIKRVKRRFVKMKVNKILMIINSAKIAIYLLVWCQNTDLIFQ
jgi:hypothetical protein